VFAKDEDDDSNERDPFTDRSFNLFDLDKDYGPLRSRHPAPVQHVCVFRAAGPVGPEHAHPGADGAADHRVTASAER
jgi:hypothetical protein